MTEKKGTHIGTETIVLRFDMTYSYENEKQSKMKRINTQFNKFKAQLKLQLQPQLKL